MATSTRSNPLPTKEERTQIRRLHRMRDIAYDGVIDRHDVWKENEEYYLGIQWDEDRLDKMASWRAAPVYNVIFQAVEHLLSLLTDQRPQAFTYNRAGGTERVANLLTSHLEQLHLDLGVERKDSLKWKDKLICGTSFWKVVWDFKEKQVDTVRVAPDRIFPDPQATDFDNCRYVLELMDMPMSDVLEMYPNKYEEIVNSRSDDFKGIFDRNTGEAIREAKVNVWQCWYKDTSVDEVEVHTEGVDKKEFTRRKRRYPRGRVTTFVGDVILDDRKNPLKFDGKDKVFPYVRDVLIEQRNEFWGISLVDVMKDQQDELNILEAQIFDNIKSVVNALVVVAEGALDIDTFVNAPGGVQEVQTDGTQPLQNVFQRLPGINIASDVFRFRDIKVDELLKMAGITDTLTGNVGASQRPGAIRAAFEASMSRMREMIRNNNRALSRMGEKQLDIMQDKYEVGRFIAVSNKWDDVSDLQSPTNQDALQKALQDPNVMREYRAIRVQKQIRTPNDAFAEQAEVQRGINPEATEQDIRDILKVQGVLEYQNDITIGKYGYQVDVGPMQARDRESYENKVIDLLRYGNGTIVDAQAVHELLDLPNKERTIQRLDELNRLRQENEAMKQQLQQSNQGSAPSGQLPQ